MSSAVLCAGTLLITLHKLSHLILETALKGNIFIASFTGEDSHAQRGQTSVSMVTGRMRSGAGMSAHVSPGAPVLSLLQLPLLKFSVS